MTYDTSKADPKGTKSLMAIDADDGYIKDVFLEVDVRGMRIVNYVWDTDTLSNVRMTQPLTAAGIADLDLAAKNIFWAETRIEYSGDNPIYVGYNETLGAATSATDWQVKKITYTGSNPTRIQIQLTSWDLRTAGWS